MANGNRPIPSVFDPGGRYLAPCMGDSLTHNPTLGVRPDQFWPARLQARARALGMRIACGNFGKSGNTTQDMIARSAEITYNGPSKIGFLFGGVNDPGGKSVTSITRSGATATATTAAPHNLRVGDAFTVAGAAQSDYNITGTVVSVPSATTFTYTVANSPATPATGTTLWSTPTAQTTANEVAIANVMIANGATMIIVVSPQFLNYTVGGESTSQTKPAGAYGGVYDAGVNAVAALNAQINGVAVFCDLWTYMKTLITSHVETLGSASWHVDPTNQHLNALGEDYVAQAILEKIVALPAWQAALTEG